MIFKYFRKLYDWVISKADSKYARSFLFGLAFAEASFFPIPPDVLQITMCVSKPKKSFQYALIAAFGSILGAVFGYFLGLKLWELISPYFFQYVPSFTHENFMKVSKLYNENGFVAVFTAAFTPIPYKVFTISAGVFKINFFLFLLASAIGRSMRFFAVSALFYKFGASIRDFIEKRFNMLSILFIILLVGGFYIIKYILK